MKSFVRLVNVDAGFRSQNVLVSYVALSGPKYANAGQSREFFDRLLERMAAVRGVEAVGATSNLPMAGSDNWSPISIEGQPDPPPGHAVYAPLRVVSSGYFRALGIPVRAGRVFGSEDARIAVPLIRWYPQQANPPNFEKSQPIPVAVISQTMARQYWPGQDPLGRRFRVLFSPWITVVGVVGDVKHASLDAPVYPHIYLPYSQEPQGEMTLVMKTGEGTKISAATVRGEVRRLDAALPVTVLEMDELLSDSVGRQRFYLGLASAFGALALGLAVIGIFGLASYSVSQRVSEIGIRMALGAQRHDILRMILGEGLLPALAGAAAGSAGALALAGLIKGLLFQVSPLDPMVLGSVLLLVAPIALLASYIPARRAIGIDPMVALRCE
jgi:putative ABC transport system permease protein